MIAMAAVLGFSVTVTTRAGADERNSWPSSGGSASLSQRLTKYRPVVWVHRLNYRRYVRMYIIDLAIEAPGHGLPNAERRADVRPRQLRGHADW